MYKPTVFCEIPCLTETSKIFDGVTLRKRWFKNSDKRSLDSALLKFIEYNSKYFDFLNVKPFITGTDISSGLQFRTSSFVGTIPLRAPDTGKQIGDFVVTPKYVKSDKYSDYIEILALLKSEIEPEIIHSFPLLSGNNYQPPLYLEAIKFIDTLSNLIKTNWSKFSKIEKILNEPRGQVNWTKYIANQYKVENTLRYPSSLNVQSEFHREYNQIKFVFDLCKTELYSTSTPLNIKLLVADKISHLDQALYFHKPFNVSRFEVKSADSPLIKKLKVSANKILRQKFIECTAWRIDFTNVFEKFVQFIFAQFAHDNGGKLSPNFKINGHTSRNTPWALKYLEPDAVYQKDGLLIMIDAKYKSHLYNKNHLSDLLKEEHRSDLHQILGYSSFQTAQKKISFLCYPSNEVELNYSDYNNSINQTSVRVYILGIPLNVKCVSEVKKKLQETIDNIYRKECLTS